ncbi:MAG: hypothetical protein SFZ02_11335 [bacterium]|nr:hypothetical protein [bacterium]
MSSKTDKLLKKLYQTKTGWSAKDLSTLYEHFGFTIRLGSKHDIITHPDFPEIRDMLPRGSSELSPDYARDALKSIKKVLSKQDELQEDVEEDKENE